MHTTDNVCQTHKPTCVTGYVDSGRIIESLQPEGSYYMWGTTLLNFVPFTFTKFIY